MARVFLGLGSNLGDRKRNLQRALALLSPQVTVTAVSSLYDSTPVGVLAQPRFLNAVCEGQTELAPEDLLRHVKGVESLMGRVPTVRYGPRNIDIDILTYDCTVVRSPSLTIPHPQISTRPFVVHPLAELAPTLTLPGQDAAFADLAAKLPAEENGLVRVEGPDWVLPSP